MKYFFDLRTLVTLRTVGLAGQSAREERREIVRGRFLALYARPLASQLCNALRPRLRQTSIFADQNHAVSHAGVI